MGCFLTSDKKGTQNALTDCTVPKPKNIYIYDKTPIEMYYLRLVPSSNVPYPKKEIN